MRTRHAATVVGVSYPPPGSRPGDPHRGSGPGWDPRPPGANRRFSGGTPGGQGSAGRPAPSGGSGGSRPPGRPPGRPAPGPGGGRSFHLDPVLAECLIGVAWLTVGTLGLGADGAGTLLLAIGIAVVVVVLVENRRRGSRPFGPRQSSDLLRYAAGAVVAVVVVSILLGLIGWSEYGPGLAAVITGVAFVALSRSTGQRPTQWLGGAFVVLGVLAVLLATQEASGFASQGLLGLVAGVLLLLSAADRIGLLESLRDRMG